MKIILLLDVNLNADLNAYKRKMLTKKQKKRKSKQFI